MTWLLLPHRQVSSGARGKHRRLICMWHLAEGKGGVMSLPHRAGVLAEDLQSWGHLKVIIRPRRQFVLAFAISFGIQFYLVPYGRAFGTDTHHLHPKYQEIGEGCRNVPPSV